MSSTSKNKHKTLDERFAFEDQAVVAGLGRWTTQLRSGVGREDGEHYLLRIFRKTGTPLDSDLRRLIDRGVRPIRRVLTSRRARELLVEFQEIIEDDNEIAIVMMDPGQPLAGAMKRARPRLNALLVSQGRKVFWRNIARIAEALGLCHDAGIIHGGISNHAIFSHREGAEDYRLGGYETCVHISNYEGTDGSDTLSRTAPMSFRQDWIDLGQVAADVLSFGQTIGPSLLAIERRMLDRLSSPPQFQLFDAAVVLHDLQEVVDELERIGSSAEGEFVLYPSTTVLQSDVPALTSGAVNAADTDALLRFVDEDLRRPGLRVIPTSGDIIRLVTDLAIFDLRIVGDAIASLIRAHTRRPADRVYDAFELASSVHLSRNRRGAEERVQKLGPGARKWADLTQADNLSRTPQDIPVWYALILLEAFTLLREQFRSYPVEVVDPPKGEAADLTWLSLRNDLHNEQRRVELGLRPLLESLRHELASDDGKIDWTLSKADTLGARREKLPYLKYESGGQIGGRLAFGFQSSEMPNGRKFFLKPRTDSGFEKAIKRRLQTIVAARGNIDLMRALNDPAQVAFDGALRMSAAPGEAPAEMDQSKRLTWATIAEGRSINVVVGPPGVGKSYLISNLVQSILAGTPDARVLVSAQNHETLINMEAELLKVLAGQSAIVVRVERPNGNLEEGFLRQSSRAILQSAANGTAGGSKVLSNQQYQIEQALTPVSDSEKAVADQVFRDTDNLLLRSSDVTLATTSSYAIEEMIADGEQFDWVIIEEAARANASELLGALLLGNRRVMIGDHNQLSPFDLIERQKYYDSARAAELLRTSKDQLSTISDLPQEILEALESLKSDDQLLIDVLATASRLEEPFRTIVEREDDREKAVGRPSAFVSTLLEQSRMHPAISSLVSNTFYDKKLQTSSRVHKRPTTVETNTGLPDTPIVVLNLPSLSTVRKRAFEARVNRSYRNDTEAEAVAEVLGNLTPVSYGSGPPPTLAILSPYLAQVNSLEQRLSKRTDPTSGTLFGFRSPRDNGKFVFTSDGFQGGEAEVIVASLVRNSVFVGKRALGFLKNPQRMNVLLSRARQKLVLVTSLKFIEDAVTGVDPEGVNPEFRFLRTMLEEIDRLTQLRLENGMFAAAIVNVSESGRIIV